MVYLLSNFALKINQSCKVNIQTSHGSFEKFFLLGYIYIYWLVSLGSEKSLFGISNQRFVCAKVQLLSPVRRDGCSMLSRCLAEVSLWFFRQFFFADF